MSERKPCVINSRTKKCASFSFADAMGYFLIILVIFLIGWAVTLIAGTYVMRYITFWNVADSAVSPAMWWDLFVSWFMTLLPVLAIGAIVSFFLGIGWEWKDTTT